MSADYTKEGFTIPIERDGVKGYASIHRMFYGEEDGLDTMGYYFVYVLDPNRGSSYFRLAPTGRDINRWKIETEPILVAQDIIAEIIQAIEQREGKKESA